MKPCNLNVSVSRASVISYHNLHRRLCQFLIWYSMYVEINNYPLLGQSHPCPSVLALTTVRHAPLVLGKIECLIKHIRYDWVIMNKVFKPPPKRSLAGFGNQMSTPFWPFPSLGSAVLMAKHLPSDDKIHDSCSPSVLRQAGALISCFQLRHFFHLFPNNP